MNIDNTLRIQELRQEIQTLEKEIAELNKVPATRPSTHGSYMLQPIWVYTARETKDEILGRLRGQLLKLINTDGKELYYININSTYFVALHAENGVVKSGGLLNNYFVGRPLSEQLAYVRSKGCVPIKTEELEKIVNDNILTIKLKLYDSIIVSLSCEHKISSYKKKVQISNKQFQRIDKARGASRAQKRLLTYYSTKALKEYYLKK